MHVGRRSNGVGGEVFGKLDVEAGFLGIVKCIINVLVVVHGNVCICVCLFKGHGCVCCCHNSKIPSM